MTDLSFLLTCHIDIIVILDDCRRAATRRSSAMPREPDAEPEDHRPRVAAERRERMHNRLVESALVVFGQRGVDATIVDELIRTAGVSRGTFYNYFRTNEDVLVAVSVAVSNEMLRLVDPFAHAEADPAARIAVGMRLF